MPPRLFRWPFVAGALRVWVTPEGESEVWTGLYETERNYTTVFQITALSDSIVDIFLRLGDVTHRERPVCSSKVGIIL